MKMTDIHCHILPGIDDGAADMDMSLQMLKMACKQGFTRFVATPHAPYADDGFAVPDKVLLLCSDLKCRADEILHIKIDIVCGQEIMYTDSVPDRLRSGELMTLGGSSYVLIEFFPDTPYPTVYGAVRRLKMEQYSPVIAHIERMGPLHDESHIEELTEAGAYMQMNYRSVGGKWYDGSVRRCRRLLEGGYIHFLGTDMHNLTSRAPKTQEAIQWMEKHLETAYIEAVCGGNAEKVLKNEII